MITGAATIFVVKNYIKIENEYFYELLPGFILAFIAIILVSLITVQPSEETLQKFDESQSETSSADRSSPAQSAIYR